MLLVAQPQPVRRRDDFVKPQAAPFRPPAQTFVPAPATTVAPTTTTTTGPVVEVEEIRDDSLNRLRTTHSGTKQYVIAGNDFESFPEIHKNSAAKMKARGIMNLFPIQEHCFYPIYNREDLIARDLTGSGKTLAFALPIVEFLRKNGCLGKRRLQAIVLAPTRELAI